MHNFRRTLQSYGISKQFFFHGLCIRLSNMTIHNITVKPEWYASLLCYLKTFFPKSLPVFHLVRGIQQNDFAWESVEFVADQWPFPRAIVCRPIKKVLPNGKLGYECRQVCPYTVTIWSSDDTVLGKMLQQPDSLDWNDEIMFHGLSCPTNLETVNTVCQSHGRTIGYDMPSWCTDVYELRPENLPKCSVNLPPGFILTNLTIKHAEQINNEWDYGGGTPTRNYLLDVLDSNRKNYPTAAVVEVESGRAVSYILYEPEGNLAMGYTDPNHRNKGFFRIVSFALASTLFAMGRKSIYLQITPTNAASRNAYLKLGAKQIEGWKQHWLLYVPKSATSPISYPLYNYVKNAEKADH